MRSFQDSSHLTTKSMQKASCKLMHQSLSIFFKKYDYATNIYAVGMIVGYMALVS
jgi:hypothetical protein